MNKLNTELESFIRNFISTNKIKNVDLRDLNLETSLDLDLNLFDLDIDLFISDFIQQFNIDYSKFDWARYGYPAPNFFVAVLRSFFNYKIKWVKHLAARLYKPRIKVHILQQAIETGVLI